MKEEKAHFRRRLGMRSVGLAKAAEGTAVIKETARPCHEVGVGLQVGSALQRGENASQECGSVSIRRAGRCELGQPDGLVAQLVGVLDVGEESVGILCPGVPVHIAKVVLAASLAVAGGNPLLQPVQALARCATVGYGWSTNQSLSTELVHVLDVTCSSITRAEVGLPGIVRLVEAEKSLASLRDGALGVGLPVVGVNVSSAPKHWNVVDIVNGATGR